MKRLVKLFPMAAVLLLAGCAGSISIVNVGLPTEKERPRLIAAVDRFAGQEGLRALPDKPFDVTGSFEREYHTATGKGQGISIFWDERNKTLVDIVFPDDGSLEPLAVRISDYAAGKYGKGNVSVVRRHPAIDWLLDDWGIY
ncbi:MAG TPA: hypothetical protein VG733_13920 [Chthoniobacteraceae bacterium]|nr:hypothetical protein [Chthoniobacteraceae bacterium]